MISKRSCLISTSHFENKSSREHALSTMFPRYSSRENMLGNLQNFKERLILDESSHFIWESNMQPLRGEKKKKAEPFQIKIGILDRISRLAFHELRSRYYARWNESSAFEPRQSLGGKLINSRIADVEFSMYPWECPRKALSSNHQYPWKKLITKRKWSSVYCVREN